MGDPLGERRVQACTALLDEPEVEARRIGDRLQVVRRSKVAIVSRDGWKLSHAQALDRLRKGVSEIWILVIAAVARPPTGIHCKLHQVGESADLLSAGCLT